MFCTSLLSFSILGIYSAAFPMLAMAAIAWLCSCSYPSVFLIKFVNFFAAALVVEKF